MERRLQHATYEVPGGPWKRRRVQRRHRKAIGIWRPFRHTRALWHWAARMTRKVRTAS